jgi:hypothetical protein
MSRHSDSLLLELDLVQLQSPRSARKAWDAEDHEAVAAHCIKTAYGLYS